MTFRKFDAGDLERGKYADGDCQVRAYATAKGVSWGDAWATLYVKQGQYRACGFTLTEFLRDGIISSIRKLDFPAVKGRARMTGAEFCKKYPKGRFILRMAGHVACVKDGVLFDRFDSSKKCVYTAWEVAKRSE